MKKIVSTLLICVLLIGCVMTLASCGKILSGKYEGFGVTYEFSGLNKVTKTIGGSAGSVSVTIDTVEGEYEITENDDGESIIKLTFNGETETKSFATGEEDGVKYIKIGGLKYTKAD